MPEETFVVPTTCSRPSLVMLASIGATSCTAADMVHEALGHGTASWLTGDWILSIYTVALVNATDSRFGCAAATAIPAGTYSLPKLDGKLQLSRARHSAVLRAIG
jgi:hypothetical protein